MDEHKKVPKRIAQTVLNSLKGGVVPRIGLPYITVGRKNEIEALLHDVDIIAEGGASFRFIVGRYGSGKSFLLQTIRNYVMDRGFIVADADLSPERRLQGTRGQGLATYRELISNLSTKTKPEGGALTLVLDRWISAVQSEAVKETGLSLWRTLTCEMYVSKCPCSRKENLRRQKRSPKKSCALRRKITIATESIRLFDLRRVKSSLSSSKEMRGSAVDKDKSGKFFLSRVYTAVRKKVATWRKIRDLSAKSRLQKSHVSLILPRDT